ncbi:integral membrane protein [Aspergillus campestris IBT 28561]|uniref:Integral membrane protein n=1 Tax=Aspergillus campestris (strain IBT 28561) TaxID=1392248 RepID=A0A2I1D7C5_ASPC2|nr:uncharacterized protein P168DRAFT_130309 [Aspergillus campestris IBT 28561]PKY05753.1 integral membrane protein [Aspergillus campestris IBT 28561]
MQSSLSDPPEGLVGGYKGATEAVEILVVCFSAVALYNSIELVAVILLTFNRYTGLYFWTLLLSDVFGVVPHAVGYVLAFFGKGPIWVGVTLSTLGFYLMVPGQSFVLYSRLHLLVQNRTLLRGVLYLIIFNTIVLLVPTTVLTYSTIYLRTEPVIRGYNVMERLQVACFCAQEMFISALYIIETAKLLRLRPARDAYRNRIMYELITINVVIILMDVALLVMQYVGLYILQTTLKAAVYSVKLKLECAVLRKLVLLVNQRASESSSSDRENYPNFVNPLRVTADVTRPPKTSKSHSQSPWGPMSEVNLG